jgi:hypothetical protein
MSEIKTISKEQFLNDLIEGRKEWEAVLAEVGRERMEIQGVAGDWSVKDIVAHVAAYERWTSEKLDEAYGRPAPTDDEMESAPGMHERNAIIFRRNRDRDLDEVLAESHQVFAYFADQMRAVPEEGFHDPAVIGLDPGWTPTPWKLFVGNSYEHYRDHIPQIREWLSRLEAGGRSRP